MIEIARAVLLLSGSLFIFIGAIGIWNLPDAICRAHALTKALTLGIILMLLSLLMNQSVYPYGTKVFLAILFQLFTIPVSGHIFGLFAYSQQKKKQPKKNS